ncbi:unnamed protein product [Cylindrotheca closterium]|uniref:Uncharacterized protein n=1 Tax=Cylindrotheca closterium TaxID=2856 RepID=A0AAD2PWC9_9STRA|nr:unnamed protein product [Cylindrotheca closterium]
MHRTFQFLIGLLIVVTIQAGLICPLCGSANKVPTRWDHVVSQSPLKTCRSIYFELAMRPINHPTCAPMQQQYQATCCNAAPAPAPAPAPVPSGESGGHPYCRICRNDDFPGNPEVMISARYVGTYSCGTLYHRGKNGQIPGFMCGPLQDRIYEKCGCGQTPPTNRPTPPPAPRPTPNPTRRPTPQPTRRPTPRPTGRPTPRPTRRPTPQPTRRPTPQPTRHPTPRPTRGPTPNPTRPPTRRPTLNPTPAPTRPPTPAPTTGQTPKPNGQYERKRPEITDKFDLRLPRRHAYQGFNQGGFRRGLSENQANDNPVLVEN